MAQIGRYKQVVSINGVFAIADTKKYGVDCLYYAIDRKRGLKVFRHRKTAQQTRKRQQQLSKRGLAPLVLSLCKTVVKIGEKHQYTGFVTEQVQECKGTDRTAIRRFAKTLQQHGCGSDIKSRNFGWRAGKIVLLDTGRHSTLGRRADRRHFGIN